MSFRKFMSGLAVSLLSLVSAIDAIGSHDLQHFITRPDLTPPKYEVKIYDEDALSPGYWFVAPYTRLHAPPPDEKYTPGQIGPCIFDSNGDLVWSGASIYDNRNSFDFKTFERQGKHYLSFIVGKETDDMKGAGLILDDRFQSKRVVPAPLLDPAFNMHEFNVIEDGQTSLVITWQPMEWDLAEIGAPGARGWIGEGGFEEIDTVTGQVKFAWHSLHHVPLSEALVNIPPVPPPRNTPWDYVHMNSVDKDSEGNYLVSARYTSTIYKISGVDGRIIWRLGGKSASFRHANNFVFSSQHHARFRAANATHEVISFLNNAADDFGTTSDHSSAYLVMLDKTTMTATLVQSIPRPDGGLTRLRGNVQFLPPVHKDVASSSDTTTEASTDLLTPLTDSNIFVSWSENSYISEHAPNGKLLMTANFVSHRFATYRAYKFANFISHSPEVPILKSFVYGTDPLSLTTTIYISWNGATEVRSWKIWSVRLPHRKSHLQLYHEDDFNNIVESAHDDDYGSKNTSLSFRHLATIKKSGFETMYMISGQYRHILAQALDEEGNVIGRSGVFETELPNNGDWAGAGWRLDTAPADSATGLSSSDYGYYASSNSTDEDGTLSTLLSTLSSSFETLQSSLADLTARNHALGSYIALLVSGIVLAVLVGCCCCRRGRHGKGGKAAWWRRRDSRRKYEPVSGRDEGVGSGEE